MKHQCLAKKAAGTLAGVAVILTLFAAAARLVPRTVAVSGRTSVTLPIIMYHSVLKDETRIGKYVVSPDSLREDFAYLQEHGYTAVFMSDVINYVYSGIPLPDKPIVLTFDDGYMNNLEYVLPLLIEFDMKAVISVVGEYTDEYTASCDRNPAYSYLFWDDIAALSASGYVEIANHSYCFHHTDGARRGASKKRGETAAEYAAALEADAMRLQLRLGETCGAAPFVFTYPYGLTSECSDEILRGLGFLATLGCHEKINVITDEDSLFPLGRYNRSGLSETAVFMRKILSD